MKVGIVCPYSWDMPGGVKQHIDDLAQALIAQGHDVSVIAPTGDDADLPAYVTGAGRAIPVPYNGSVARMSFGFISAARVRRWVRDGSFDVLHIHEPLIPSLGVLACWAARGPIVATFHASFSRSRAIAVAEPLLRSALEKLTGRIAVSDAARKSLVEQFGGDTVLIPNGVTVARYAEAEPLDDWGPDGRTLGFLGRLDEERKGFPILIEAMKLLPADVKLLVAGPGEAKIPKSLRDRVTLLGMVSEQDKIRAYHSVDVFCAPNTRGESFGIVLAEAMASGATVLASDIPAFRRVLGEGQAGAMFANGDPESLAREATALLEAPERRAKLAAEALVAVRKYDWSTVARDVVRVYETVTASGAGRVEEDLL
ncbi:glycosyltransferase family 4 protein [Nonomuraea sp. NPDC050536]|uniref:glycosyltransferase family 4 protein n=1 Tax=Nonomuraea sp. NPDC050536 TaxID=3364366 RepID=UPI0037CB5040